MQDLFKEKLVNCLLKWFMSKKMDSTCLSEYNHNFGLMKTNIHTGALVVVEEAGEENEAEDEELYRQAVHHLAQFMSQTWLSHLHSKHIKKVTITTSLGLIYSHSYVKGEVL